MQVGDSRHRNFLHETSLSLCREGRLGFDERESCYPRSSSYFEDLVWVRSLTSEKRAKASCQNSIDRHGIWDKRTNERSKGVAVLCQFMTNASSGCSEQRRPSWFRLCEPSLFGAHFELPRKTGIKSFCFPLQFRQRCRHQPIYFTGCRRPDESSVLSVLIQIRIKHATCDRLDCSKPTIMAAQGIMWQDWLWYPRRGEELRYM